jgi:ketosteroid isomerase-like protein
MDVADSLEKTRGVGNEERSMSVEANKALIRRLLEAHAKGDLDALEEMLAPDFVNHSLLPGQVSGREGYILSVTEAHLSRMFQGVHPKFIALRYGGDRRTREGGDV